MKLFSEAHGNSKKRYKQGHGRRWSIKKPLLTFPSEAYGTIEFLGKNIEKFVIEEKSV
jgi:hypothetical protein